MKLYILKTNFYDESNEKVIGVFDCMKDAEEKRDLILKELNVDLSNYRTTQFKARCSDDEDYFYYFPSHSSKTYWFSIRSYEIDDLYMYTVRCNQLDDSDSYLCGIFFSFKEARKYVQKLAHSRFKVNISDEDIEKHRDVIPVEEFEGAVPKAYFLIEEGLVGGEDYING